MIFALCFRISKSNAKKMQILNSDNTGTDYTENTVCCLFGQGGLADLFYTFWIPGFRTSIAILIAIRFYLIAFAPFTGFTGLNLDKDGSSSACSPLLSQLLIYNSYQIVDITFSN